MGTISGTVSEATGGKFANGAVTGAFVHLFNAEGTRLVAYPKGKFVGIKKETYYYRGAEDNVRDFMDSIDYMGRNALRVQLYRATTFTIDKIIPVFVPKPYKVPVKAFGKLLEYKESEWNY